MIVPDVQHAGDFFIARNECPSQGGPRCVYIDYHSSTLIGRSTVRNTTELAGVQGYHIFVLPARRLELAVPKLSVRRQRDTQQTDRSTTVEHEDRGTMRRLP